MPVLRVDAHFTVLESALKGYVRWRTVTFHGSQASHMTPAKEQERVVLEGNLESWCNKLIEMKFEASHCYIFPNTLSTTLLTFLNRIL
jgi:exportin-5